MIKKPTFVIELAIRTGDYFNYKTDGNMIIVTLAKELLRQSSRIGRFILI